MEFTTFEIGYPCQKLDLEPFDVYDDQIDVLEAVKDGEYEGAIDAAQNLHPRTGHELFRYSSPDGVRVEEEHIDRMIDVLEDNSENSRTSVGEWLFRSGYTSHISGTELRQAVEQPRMNFPDENLPDYSLIPRPFRDGREKREADDYYGIAVGYMFRDFDETDLEIM